MGKTMADNTFQELLLPYALEGSNAVSPARAIKNRKYSCPICSQEVFLRDGEINRAHFAHFKDSSCTATSESIQHLEAKFNLYRSLTGETDPINVLIPRSCLECKSTHRDRIKLDSSLGLAQMEYSFQTLSGHRLRPDIAVLNKDETIRFIIEVVFSHAVDDEKSTKIGEIPWFEVTAKDVSLVGKIPVSLTPTNGANFLPMKSCPTKSIQTHPARRTFPKKKFVPRVGSFSKPAKLSKKISYPPIDPTKMQFECFSAFVLPSQQLKIGYLDFVSVRTFMICPRPMCRSAYRVLHDWCGYFVGVLDALPMLDPRPCPHCNKPLSPNPLDCPTCRLECRHVSHIKGDLRTTKEIQDSYHMQNEQYVAAALSLQDHLKGTLSTEGKKVPLKLLERIYENL